MNLIKTAFALAVAIAATGCTHRITDFTFLSTKNVDLSQAASFERGTTRATGEDQVYIIVFIPTGIPNIKEATDRAIESVPGAVGLVDGVVYRKWFVLPLLGGFDKFTVEGTPLINKKALKLSGFDTGYIVSTYNEESKKFESRSVTKEVFQTLRQQYTDGAAKSSVDQLPG